MSNKTVWDNGCPPELRAAEFVTLGARRKAAGFAKPEPEADYRDAVGVGLSGGGIRSATFVLGVFQALAKLDLLKRIDFLSTVSGGGYFGGFYGRLVSRQGTERDSPAAMEQVRRLLHPDAAGTTTDVADRGRRILRWLRENGRYLAPTGGGDYLMALAVMLRNWFAVQVIVLLTAFMVFLAARVGLAAVMLQVPDNVPLARLGFTMALTHWPVWLSPLVPLAALLFAGVLFPLAWAYWIASLGWNRRPGALRWITSPLTGPLAIMLMAALIAASGDARLSLLGALLLLLSFAAAIAVELCLFADFFAARGEQSGDVDRRHAVGKRLSGWLRNVLMWTLVVLAVGVVDSVGQTVYALGTISHFGFGQWLLSLGTALVALVAGGQKLVIQLGLKGDSSKLPLGAIAAAGSLLLLFVAACGLNYGAQAVVWKMQQPADLPKVLQQWAEERRCAELGDYCKQHGGCPEAAPVCHVPEAFKPLPTLSISSCADLFAPAATVAVFLLLALILGTQWEFVNLSTLQPLYGARLARAYLGASNASRTEGGGISVTDPIPGDDVAGSEYWTGASAPWRRGGPLHLVNVTINETIDGQSQVEQQDRRGTGMAVSATGLSVGVRHHRLWSGDIDSHSGHHVFGDDSHPPEDLALSQWVGISGAAFSTGLGFQTSFGLSLLAGVLNVRLGYWWRAGVSRGLLSSLLFPVQRFLMLGEWLARFPGTAHRHWYLSDGGHFENTAAYELIRRRLPLIIITDGGADPDYQFDDVANLVRKARIDFNAEINFFSKEQILQRGQELLGDAARYFGGLDELKKHDLQEEPEDGQPAAPAPPRRPCAALARVTYLDDDQRTSWLLVLKPILHRDDPADLVNYGKLNPTFPNETTIDQFFDEAQWESYRKLGELTAMRVFGKSPNERSDPDHGPLSLFPAGPG